MSLVERLPDACPKCGAPVRAWFVGVGHNDDGTTYVYCGCGYVLDGEEKAPCPRD